MNLNVPEKKERKKEVNHQRIKLEDTSVQIGVKMSEGNIGAATVIVQLFKRNAEIDPQSALGPYSSVLHLDSLGIYGSKIWMLYKDVCSEDIRKMIALLRAYQLGFTSESTIKAGIEQYGAGIDLDDLVSKVENALPDFKRTTVTV